MIRESGVCADGTLCANAQGFDQHSSIQVYILPQRVNIVVDLGVLHLKVLTEGADHIRHNQARLAGSSGIDENDIPDVDVVAYLGALLHNLADSFVAKLLSGKDPCGFAAMEPGPSIAATDTGA